MAKVAADKNRPCPVWTVDPLLSGQSKSQTTASNPGVENAAFYDSESTLCTRLSSVHIDSITKKDGTWPPHEDTSVWYTKKPCCNGRIVVLLLSALVLFLLIAILATVAYLAIGEVRMTWEDEIFQEDDDGISVVEGHLKITNRVFNKDLLNSNSQSYHKLSAQVKQSIDAVFQQSALGPYYNETTILGYSAGSVIVKCRIHLSKPRQDATHQVGMAVIQSLERYHGYLPGGILRVDIRSLHFTGLQVTDERGKTEVLRLPKSSWGPWSEWSPCSEPCKVQSRHRNCIHSQDSQSPSSPSNTPCGPGSDREVRNCPCDLVTHHTISSETSSEEFPSTTAVDKECDGGCQDGQICILLSQTSVSRCLVSRDSNDPTGCGGWCVGEHQLCRPLGNTTFQCVDNAVCDDENEWRCSNGLCISQTGRCDGILDCYDMSDEFDCDCGAGEFHCGNNTSCLPQTVKCNGQVDCWDGSDEKNCTPICPVSQYTCNNGHCIDKLRFCDGFSDCEDRSDEPEGCNAPCLHTQNQCRNGRCVNASLWCNGVDNCGDATDEYACDFPKLLQSL